MAAQKFTRKELKKDPFVMQTERALSFIQEHATALGVGLVLLVVLLVGGTYLRQGQAASQQEASYLLYLGQNLVSQGDYMLAIAPLEECIEKHGRTDFAKYARVALAQALLGFGEVDNALMRIEVFRDEVGSRHPAVEQLALLHAHALADRGDFEEAARAIGEITNLDLADEIYYDRVLQRARWFDAAGQHIAALNVLTELRDRIRAGLLQVTATDGELELRLEVTRAMAL